MSNDIIKIVMKYVVVKVLYSNIESEIVRGMLLSNGINSIIRGDVEESLYPIPFQLTNSSIKIMVSENDYKSAKKLITQVERQKQVGEL